MRKISKEEVQESFDKVRESELKEPNISVNLEEITGSMIKMGGKRNMSNDTTKIEETKKDETTEIAMTELIEEIIKLRLKELEYIKAIKTLNERLKTEDIFDTSSFLEIEKFDIEAISYYYRKTPKIASSNANSISYSSLVKSQKITGWDLKFLIAYILPTICY